MNDEDAFLRAIAAAPDDLAPRLVFADWLDERGDPRGPWLRDPVIRPWMGLRVEDPVPRLIEALADEAEAANVLVRIGGPAVPGLLQALRRFDEYGRNLCRSVLVRLAEDLRPYRAALEADLKSDDLAVRTAAAVALGCLGEVGDEAIDQIAARLENSDPLAWQAALDALGDLGPAAGRAVPRILDLWKREADARAGTDFRWSASITLARIAPGGPEAIPVLVSALAHPVLAAVAPNALGGYGAAAVPAVIAALGWLDGEGGRLAMQVLSEAADAAGPFFADLLGRAELPARARRTVLAWCVTYRGWQARPLIPAVIRQLDDDDPYVARAAAAALGGMGVATDEVLPALDRATRDGSEDVRAAAIEALVQLAPETERTRTALRRGLGDRQEIVRAAAWQGYVRRNAQAAGLREARALLRETDPEYRERGVEALGRLLVGSHQDEGEDDEEVEDEDDEEVDDEPDGPAAEATDLLLEAMEDRSRAVRRAAVAVLAAHVPRRAADAVEPLRKALRDDRDEVRADAARALSRLDHFDEETIPALLDASRDVATDVACAALVALGSVRERSSAVVRRLTSALRDRRGKVRAAGLRGIAALGHVPGEVARALLELARDPEEDVRLAAIDLVEEVNPPYLDRAFEVFRIALGDSSRAVRALAVERLSAWDDESVGPLAAELARLIETESDAEIADSAVQLLLENCASRALVLLPLLAHADDRVRARALTAIEWAGESAGPGVPHILAELDRQTEQTWEPALRALPGIGLAAGPAVPRLLVLMQSEDPNTQALAAGAARGLCTTGVPLISRLDELARHPAEVVRSATAGALASLCCHNDEPIPLVLALLRGDDVAATLGAADAIQYLGERGEPFVPELVRHLSAGDAHTRMMVMTALGGLGATAAPAVPALARLVGGDRDVVARRATADALGGIGPAAAAALPDLVRAAGPGEAQFVRRAAIRALGKLRSPTALPALRRLLRDRDFFVRQSSAEAIGALGPAGADGVADLCRHIADSARAAVDDGPDERVDLLSALVDLKEVAAPAIPTVRRLLDDPNDLIRWWAVEVLAAVGPVGQPALRAARRHEDEVVREAAEQALAKKADESRGNVKTTPR